jgi:hypothetical protein
MVQALLLQLTAFVMKALLLIVLPAVEGLLRSVMALVAKEILRMEKLTVKVSVNMLIRTATKESC